MPEPTKPLTRDERVVRALLLIGESYWLGRNLIDESPELADRVAACVDAAGDPINLDLVRTLLRESLESQKATSEASEQPDADEADTEEANTDEEVEG